MRFKEIVASVLAAALTFFIGTSAAAAKGSSKPKVKPVTAKAPKAKAPKANVAKTNAPAVKAPKAKSTAPKAKSNTPKAKSSAPQAQANNVPGGSNTPGGNTPGGNDTPGANDPGAPLSKAQQLLAKNTNLRTRLQSRLPPNTDINAAAAGFRNLGQFVAAVNVSYNQGIPFADLKVLMTGDQPLSLGQALQQLRGLDANAANQVANPAITQANQEINAANAVTTNTVTTKKSKDRH